MEGPLTGPVAVLGQEQLHFAELAVAADNAANKTNISIVQGDTPSPAQAVTVTRQFTSNSKIVAVVGPTGTQQVIAVGPLMSRAALAFISGSATNATLTTGKYPTFFRTVSKESVQGPQDANYIVTTLHPKALMIVDDEEAYSTGLVSAMTPIFTVAGITVDHESVQQTTTDFFSSLVAKVTPAMTVVVLPWQVAANAQQFGRNLAQEHKTAVIFGIDGLFSPGTFTISGSYVSSFGPDITAIPADAAIVAAAKAKHGSFGTFGPPSYAAAHVIDEAIASVCKSGQTPTRANVLAVTKTTNEATSILGQPISFTSNGDLVNRKFFLFKITSTGRYQLIPSS
jgi:branched-chain amino acid transport system substrate-binding protein